MTTPIHHDILITQGQTWVYLFEHADLVSEGNGLRLHIRDHHGASLVRCALTHDGAANARVSFVSGGVLAYLGASISTGWDLQAYKQRRWVYALERYSLSDPDDVTVLRLGDCLVNANPADESSIGTVAPFPSYDLVCLRFDIEQTLSVEQQARVRANAGFPEGAIVDWGGIGGDLADQADLAAALAAKSSTSHTHGNASTGAAGFMSAADKTKLDGVATGATANDTDANLRARSSHTGTQTASSISDFASAASAAAPVQSVAGRTGAVTIAVGDVSGAESTANKAQPSGYASLDSSGKLPQAQLPSIAISEFLGEAANQAAMLALTGQKGDWCIRTDTGATWIITGTDPTLLGSWTAISYPTSAVTSVAGRTGAVTLSTSDISGLGTAAAANTGDFAAASHTHNASDINAGTLDAARLPAPTTTALGGVKRNTGSAGQFVTGIDSDGSLLRDTPAGASPAGSGSELQYRVDPTTFGAMAGTAWDNTNRSLTITGATVTSSKPILDLSQTLNGAGVTFDCFNISITNTASATSSRFIRCQIGGVTRFGVQRDGLVRTYGFQSDGVVLSGLFFYTSGGGAVFYTGSGANLASSGVISWSNNSADPSATIDTQIVRDAANRVALRRGTNAHTLIVSGTYTDASNYVQGELAATSTAVTLSATTAGTGADNVPVNINAAGTSPVSFGSPAQAKSYTVATVPSASASGAGSIIYVTDESGGAVLAFSDATNWRRVTDRAVIS